MRWLYIRISDLLLSINRWDSNRVMDSRAFLMFSISRSSCSTDSFVFVIKAKRRNVRVNARNLFLSFKSSNLRNTTWDLFSVLRRFARRNVDAVSRISLSNRACMSSRHMGHRQDDVSV